MCASPLRFMRTFRVTGRAEDVKVNLNLCNSFTRYFQYQNHECLHVYICQSTRITLHMTKGMSEVSIHLLSRVLEAKER